MPARHYEAGVTTLARNEARTARQAAAKAADSRQVRAAAAAGRDRRSIGVIRRAFGAKR